MEVGVEDQAENLEGTCVVAEAAVMGGSPGASALGALEGSHTAPWHCRVAWHVWEMACPETKKQHLINSVFLTMMY